MTVEELPTFTAQQIFVKCTRRKHQLNKVQAGRISGLALITMCTVDNSSVPRSLVRVLVMWCLLSKGP